MRELRDIYHLYHERKRRLSPLHAAAMTVKAAYYGDIVLPLPELDRSEKPLVANLLFQGGEQKAMRVASTMPDVYYPSMSPGVALQDKKARQRRLINLGWWTDDRMKLKLRKRARHLVFYASSPVVVRPDFKTGRPTWQVRNPMNMFAPEMDVGDVTPDDCIFTYAKPATWLERQYPAAWQRINKGRDPIYTILEYLDEDEYVLAALGEPYTPPANSPYNSGDPSNAGASSPDGEIVELERIPNRLGKTPVVCAGRIGLEHARGEFDGVVGLWQAQAKLMALMVIGTQRAIFPEEWLIDAPTGEGAQVITHADPLHGIMGHVTGGALQTEHPLPEAFGTNIIDQLERGLRIEGGLPAELGGESTSNVRTGKRGDSILSAVLDFPIQEEQELLEVSMQEENRLAIGIDKAYFPTKKVYFLSGSAGSIEYIPEVLWEKGTDQQYPKYAHAGVDAQGLPVEIGQRIGMGIMSKRTAMETDPLIEDPQAEFDRMNTEALRAGLQASLTAMAQDPNMAPAIAQILIEARIGETEIEDAVLKVHQNMQAEQDAQAQQATQPGAEAQPGLAGGPPAIGPPTASASNLTTLLAGLHRQTTAGHIPEGGPPANIPIGAGAGAQ